MCVERYAYANRVTLEWYQINVLVLLGNNTVAAYSASKFAMRGLTQAAGKIVSQVIRKQSDMESCSLGMGTLQDNC
jgi:hypothetical protein